MASGGCGIVGKADVGPCRLGDCRGCLIGYLLCAFIRCGSVFVCCRINGIC